MRYNSQVVFWLRGIRPKCYKLVCGRGVEMIYDKLLKLALQASNEQDLPDTLFAGIRFICENKNSDPALIHELIDHLENYEPFGDVGCGNLFSSTKDVEQCVAKLLTIA